MIEGALYHQSVCVRHTETTITKAILRTNLPLCAPIALVNV
jgi:hypothetical protein